MKQSKRLSDLIIETPRKVKTINLSHIKDYDKITEIYEHYMMGRIDDKYWYPLGGMIKAYGEFRFLMDMQIFLREKTKQRRKPLSPQWADETLNNIRKLYFEKLTV